MTTLVRWLRATLIAGALMVLDGISLVVVSRVLGPRPPAWATAPFFWVLAWSVQLLSNVFPNHAPGDRGPSMVAIAGGALMDLVLLSLLVDWLYRRRRGSPGAHPDKRS